MATMTKTSKSASGVTSKKAEAKTAPAVAAPAPAAQAAKVASPPAATQTITVAKIDKKFEGARASWYTALVAHDGKTVDAFVAACTATPPSMPLSGKAEDPRGWLRWFVRERIAQVA